MNDICGIELDCPFRANSADDNDPRAVPSATMVQAVGLVLEPQMVWLSTRPLIA